MLLNTGFSLYSFHPVFEFFLTFYSVYLISEELVFFLEKKFYRVIKRTHVISTIINFRNNVIEEVEQIKTSLNELYPENVGSEAFKVRKEKVFQEFEQTKNAINDYYKEGNESGIAKDLITARAIRTFFIYYVLYCFGLLLLCGYMNYPDLDHQKIYTSLITFNFFSFITTLVLFFNPRLRRINVSEVLVLVIFALTFMVSFCCPFVDIMTKAMNWIFTINIYTAALSSIILTTTPVVISIITSVSLSHDMLTSVMKQQKNVFLARILTKQENLIQFSEFTNQIATQSEALKELKDMVGGVDDIPVRPKILLSVPEKILYFLCPLFGLSIYFYLISNKEKKARAALKFSGYGFFTYLLTYLAYFLI